VTLTRRELLRLAAAAAASPLIPEGVAAAAAAPAAAAKAGRFFSAAELAVLDELCEAIIPADGHSGGARAAGVAAFIDGKLGEFDPGIPELLTVRDAWKAGLKPFVEAAPEARLALLAKAAEGEEKPTTDAERFFHDLKEWTARFYYTSSLGIHDEMEYKGNTLLMEFEGTDPASLPRILPEP
jgi:hypothetical protein